MSVISDFKGGPFTMFNTVAPVIGDLSLDTLCGVRFSTNDGREVVLVRNGTTAIAMGKLVQAPAEVSAFNNLAITVPAATPATYGTNQILVTNGTTVLNQNQFALGYLIVTNGTGIGQTLQIASHGGGSNAGTFTVTTIDPIMTTLDATSTVSLIANPFIAVVISATGLTGVPVGATFATNPNTTTGLPASTAGTFSATTGAQTVAVTPVYGFLGCHGAFGITMDSSGTAVGLPISQSSTTAGDVTTFTAAKALVGNCMGTTTSAKVAPIYMLL